MDHNFESDFLIEDKRKRRKIIVDGEWVATAIYNPDDPNTYKQIMKIFAILDGKKTNPKDFELTKEEQEAIERTLESTTDFDTASSAFSKLNGSLQATINDIDALIDGVNAMFGEGICEILLKYGKDGEYLTGLLEVAFKEVKNSRQVIKNKYKAKKQNGVIE